MADAAWPKEAPITKLNEQFRLSLAVAVIAGLVVFGYAGALWDRHVWPHNFDGFLHWVAWAAMASLSLPAMCLIVYAFSRWVPAESHVKLKLTGAASIGVLVGAVATLFYLRLADSVSEWYTLTAAPPSISYSNEAFVDADIPLPHVGPMKGEAKFLPTNENTFVQLGYRVEVPIAGLDVAKIPPAYRQPVPHPKGSVTLPVEQVTHRVQFGFSLRDADGFVLQNIAAEQQYVQSGKTNWLQSIVPEHIPISTARRITGVALTMSVEHCETCERGKGSGPIHGELRNLPATKAGTGAGTKS